MKKRWMAGALTLMLMVSGLAGCSQAPEETTLAQPASMESVENKEQPATAAEETTQAEATVIPGTYTGTGTGAFGDIVLKVTVTETEIAGVEVEKSSETPSVGDMAMQRMAREAVKNQTTALDTVSGATGTSRGFLMALEDALSQAGAEPGAFTKETPAAAMEDAKTQLVIVGTGISGMCAAVEAAERGVEAIIVEQLGIAGGSSAHAGFMIGYDTIPQKEKKLENTYEQVLARLQTMDPVLDPAMRDEEAIQMVADESGPTIDWLIGMGADFGDPTRQDEITHYRTPPAYYTGEKTIPVLYDKITDLNIDCRLDTKATEILMENGRAAGIRVETKDGQAYTIHAQAVLLATGGGYANQEFVAEYKKELASYHYKSTGSMGADGSGILMAQSVGAQLSFMDQGSALPYTITLKNGITYIGPSGLIRSRGGILVNEEGKRFTNENNPYLTTSLAMVEQPGAHGFIILDQTSAKFNTGNTLQYMIDEGYVKISDTVEGLAKELGIDGENLKATLEAYGEMVRSEEDAEFGRKAIFLRSELNNGPYYGVEVKPSLHTTFGGIQTDAAAHVINTEGEIIPGLYASGECAAHCAQGIASNTVAAVYGRVAVRTIQEELAE